MKKNIIYLLFALLISSLFLANCNAATAYSVGGKFASGTGHDGDDFTQNVLTAANAYGWISDITSYYNNYPTESYLQSASRFGGSRAFFINSHANSSLMVIGSKNETAYRTGIHKEGNLCTADRYNLVGMRGRNFNSTNVITFAGCETGAGSDNLVTTAREEGAKAAVGFKENIVSRFNTGPSWLQKYNYALGNGFSVQTAINQANAAYPNDTLARSVVMSGNSNTTLGSASRSMSSQKNSGFVSIAPIEENYKVLNLNSANVKANANIKEFSESNYLNTIVSVVANDDESFNINDYKVTSNVINEEEGYAQIFLTYYIDGKIETNKVYLATINNYELESIILAGVTKQKAYGLNKNSLNTNSIDLLEKIQLFENVKTQKIVENAPNYLFKSENALSKANTVSELQFNDNIKDVSEKYFYDYNTNTLQYILTYTKSIQMETTEGEEFEVYEGENVVLGLD